MLWAQDYALANREAMMNEALKALRKILPPGQRINDRRINAHHNYAQREIHGEQEMWITRKGAISARLNEPGIIPGSMGAATYIVRGLGNEASYQSSSHGAGRLMSRGQAKRELTASALKEAMAGKAWNSDKADALVDESPEAYKPIDQVMKDQSDLVAIDHTLHQILNYKGTA
jgi:tRNA-splicing ligase RtcB